MKPKKRRNRKFPFRAKHQNRATETKREADVGRLLLTSPPTFESFYVEEPLLVFGDGGVSPHPKEGLENFGPILPPSDPIKIGIIGTGEGVEAFRRFLDRVQYAVSPGLNSKGKPFNPLCFPPFPGTERAFRCTFETSPSIQAEIPLRFFEKALDTPKTDEKLRNVIQLVVEKLGTLKDIEPEPQVVAVIFPSCVQDQCETIGASFRFRKFGLTQLGGFEEEKRASA